MKPIKIEILAELLQMAELTAEDRLLVEQAKQATANSYARYSHF